MSGMGQSLRRGGVERGWGEPNVSVQSREEERLGTWILGRGIIGQDHRHAFTDSGALITHVARDFNPVNLPSMLRHAANPPVESDTTQTDNPSQSLPFDVIPPSLDSQDTNKHVYVMHTYTHTHRDLHSQHVTLFWGESKGLLF